MTEEREMTAPMTSVGAEVGQSPDLTPIIILFNHKAVDKI